MEIWLNAVWVLLVLCAGWWLRPKPKGPLVEGYMSQAWRQEHLYRAGATRDYSD